MSILDRARTRESYLERIGVMAQSTQNAVKSAMNLFENFCQAQLKSSSDQIFEEINGLKGEQKERTAFDILQDFINYLDRQNLTAWTIKLTVLRVKPYFSYRAMLKIHSEDIRSELRFPKNIKRRPEPLSVETIQKVLEHSSPERKALYLLLVSSGMRIGEAVQLRKRDIEQFGGRLKVSIRAKYTKTRQPRITFLSKEAESHLRPILDNIGPDKLVFGTNEKPSQAVQNEETYFLRLREKIGYQEKYESGTSKVTIHALRSYFITKCEKINDGLGHSLAGHDRYMQSYERFTDEELLGFYLKAEPELTISEEERLRTENMVNKERQKENEQKIIEQAEKIASLERQVANIWKEFQGRVTISMDDNVKLRDDGYPKSAFFPVKLHF